MYLLYLQEVMIISVENTTRHCGNKYHSVANASQIVAKYESNQKSGTGDACVALLAKNPNLIAGSSINVDLHFGKTQQEIIQVFLFQMV